MAGLGSLSLSRSLSRSLSLSLSLSLSCSGQPHARIGACLPAAYLLPIAHAGEPGHEAISRGHPTRTVSWPCQEPVRAVSGDGKASNDCNPSDEKVRGEQARLVELGHCLPPARDIPTSCCDALRIKPKRDRERKTEQAKNMPLDSIHVDRHSAFTARGFHCATSICIVCPFVTCIDDHPESSHLDRPLLAEHAHGASI